MYGIGIQILTYFGADAPSRAPRAPKQRLC